MLSSTFLGITTFIYLLCMALYLSYLFFKNETFSKVISAVAILGFLANTAGLGLRWYESYKIGYGHIPLSNMYESLVSLSWTTVLLYLILEFRYKIKALGALIFPIVSIAIAYASFSDNVGSEIQPLVPALQSNWLTYHVMTCFIAYAAFAISFGSSIVYLIKSGKTSNAITPKEEILPSLKIIDEIIYKTIAIGFLLLGVGIITGAVWANYAWGTYWSWDPKETWSLITWFIYAAFIHARLTRGWRGKKAAVISIIGFCCVLFTFLGVNYLLSGLHSYA